MANYNSYFPQMYGVAPYTYNTNVIPNSTPQNSSNSIQWVQGEAGARSINVPAGQTIMLMDSEANLFYVKSADLSGFPLPMRIFKYEEVNAESSVDGAPATYVTKEELSEELKQLEAKLKEDKPNGKFDI